MGKIIINFGNPYPIEETAPYTLRDDARLEFFRAIKRKKPEIISSLASDVLPSYRALIKGMHWPVIWRHLTHRDEIYRGASSGVVNAMLSWASRWGLAWVRTNVGVDDLALKKSLVNEFCLNQALETLNHWCWCGVPDEPDWAYTLTYKSYIPYQTEYSTVPSIFTFKYPSWPIHADTWKSYEKKLDEAYRQAKRSYCKQRLQSAEISRDLFPPAIEKRNPAHYDWLVDYLVEGMTYAAIARKYGGHEGLSERSVSGAISSLAISLSLTLPDRKVGRPRKAVSEPIEN